MRGDLVSDVVREFQHDADAGGLGLAVDDHDVRQMREGASPVLNAVSLFLMVASVSIALVLMRRLATGAS